MRRTLNTSKSKRTAFAAMGARLGLLAVVLALIAQTFAFGAHAARAADDPRAAAAALASVVGSPVVLCVQDKGAPPDTGACHASCPFCHVAGQTLALTAPEAPADLAPPPPARIERPTITADFRPHTEPIGLPFARGPPRSL